MGKWHGNTTPMEIVIEGHPSLTPEDVILWALSSKNDFMSGDDRRAVILSALHHKAFVSYGRPTYLVSRELYDICSELDVSEQDLLHIFEKLPYSAFTLAFEKGIITTINAANSDAQDNRFELCQFAVCYPNDLEWINPLFARIPVDERESFKGKLRSPFMLIPRCDSRKISVVSDINAAKAANDDSTKVAKIAAALIMLWRSRPEFVTRIKLSKADRYPEFQRGDLSQIRTWRLPDKLIVRKPTGPSEPTGRHVKAHWRAGHFRHYRHERFEREPDGSVKVEFILPCMVHADELVEAAGNGPQANG